jgi:hypothetical protein
MKETFAAFASILVSGVFRVAVLAGVVAAMSLSLWAQWGPHPTPGVPKNAAGQPDLTAPAPKTRDGKTDFSGIWQNGGGGGGRGGRGARGAPGAAAPAAPAAPATPPAIPNASFGNVGGGFPEGLPMRPESAELVKKRMADNSKDNPDAHCLPMGFMQFHTHPQPRKIIQTPEVLIIIYEANSGLRQVFLDGRTHPSADAEPWWYGYSVGKWEGDTLVVETRGFRGNEWLDVRGSPLSDAAKVTERFRRVNYGTLEIEVNVDDPKSYTRPWTVKVNHRVMLDTELIEFICEERDATHYVGAQP